jgi:lipoprotein-releasing system ATP-binding protein
LSIDHGEFVSIEGRSGSGKSTFIVFTFNNGYRFEGQLLIHDELVTGQPDKTKNTERENGFVFQFHYVTRI